MVIRRGRTRISLAVAGLCLHVLQGARRELAISASTSSNCETRMFTRAWDSNTKLGYCNTIWQSRTSANHMHTIRFGQPTTMTMTTEGNTVTVPICRGENDWSEPEGAFYGVYRMCTGAEAAGCGTVSNGHFEAQSTQCTVGGDEACCSSLNAFTSIYYHSVFVYTELTQQGQLEQTEQPLQVAEKRVDLLAIDEGVDGVCQKSSDTDVDFWHFTYKVDHSNPSNQQGIPICYHIPGRRLSQKYGYFEIMESSRTECKARDTKIRFTDTKKCRIGAWSACCSELQEPGSSSRFSSQFSLPYGGDCQESFTFAYTDHTPDGFIIDCGVWTGPVNFVLGGIKSQKCYTKVWNVDYIHMRFCFTRTGEVGGCSLPSTRNRLNGDVQSCLVDDKHACCAHTVLPFWST